MARGGEAGLHLADPQLAEVEDAGGQHRVGTRLDGGLILRRTDVPGMQKHIGKGGTTVEGEPMELLLWAAGREGVARVEVS